jgi:hypothetical protein
VAEKKKGKGKGEKKRRKLKGDGRQGVKEGKEIEKN